MRRPFLLALLLALFLSPAAHAQISGLSASGFSTEVTRQLLDAIDFQSSIANFRGQDWLDVAIAQVEDQRAEISHCVTAREREVASITQNLGQDFIDQLAAKEQKSPEEQAVSVQIERLKASLAECKLLLERASQLQARLTRLEAEYKREQLNRRDNSVVHNLTHGLPELAAYQKGRLEQFFGLLTRASGMHHVRDMAILLVAGILIGFLVRRRARMPDLSPEQPLSLQTYLGFGYLVQKRAPLLLPIVLLLGYLAIAEGMAFLLSPPGRILMLLLGYLLTLILVRIVVRRARMYAHAELGSEIPARGLYVRLVVIVTLLFIWIQKLMILGPLQDQGDAQSLMRNLVASATILSLLEFALFLNRFPRLPRVANLIRVASAILLAVSLLLELAGFRSMSRFLWGGLVMTACLLAAYYLLERILRDFYDGLDNGKKSWQLRFRNFFSVEEDEPVPGLLWLRLLSVAAIWILLALALLKAWGAPDSTLTSLISLARNGFRFGDTQIVPSDVLVGILVFALLLMLVRWFKDSLDRKYLVRSRMDIGAREALVTITGYVGFVIAVIVGLSIAGVSFDNLAIVAGALSLGIGFGLQNIVNNFVSGIILLFERPIRTGDWIVTGSTEGFVKKISVRSTEVQTFDRSDVIVPNSELISTQVTNWTLRDKHGRVIVRVGVAYGSDTELVKKLLEEAAAEVPDIIKNRPLLPTKIIFHSFGDSALMFELRAYIYDIWRVLDVRSNLHFIIDRKFRENGIEIAFPQMDIHVRSGLHPPAETGSSAKTDPGDKSG